MGQINVNPPSTPVVTSDGGFGAGMIVGIILIILLIVLVLILVYAGPFRPGTTTPPSQIPTAIPTKSLLDILSIV